MEDYFTAIVHDGIIFNQRTSMNALVVHELQVIEDEAYKLFPVLINESIHVRVFLLGLLLFKVQGRQLL